MTFFGTSCTLRKTVRLCFFMLWAAAALGAEKAIPPQSDLDACFAGGFSMEAQLERTYSADEWAALDRALAAMNMDRHDLDFRKDYTKAHLAFPLILDMLKHPLHIAAYMDGFAGSIDALGKDERWAVPELIAAAMIHPGIGPEGLPADPASLKASGEGPGRLPRPEGDPALPEPFRPLLEAFFTAGTYAAGAFEVLGPDEFRILRSNLLTITTWHEVFESPYEEPERKRLDDLVENLKSDSAIDELAARIDLRKLMLAYLALPDPRALKERLDPGVFPQDAPLILDTPWGRAAFGTPGNDTYTGEYALVVDPGGDDVYEDCRIGAAYGTAERPVGFFLDMDGRDRYLCRGRNITLGAALLGVAAFYDLGEDSDFYEGGHVALGAAAGGIATFVDDGGSDHYSIKVFGQGAAGYGLGVMADRAPDNAGAGGSPANKEDEEVDERAIQNDRYEAWLMGQGFSRQGGVAVCHGSTGNSVYHAGGVYLHAPLFNDRYQSFSQGFSIGSRGIDYAGGIAFLIDAGGNDYYLGDIYNQGVGYWYSGGFLIDRAGNDHYEMTQYGQGSGIHLAVGGLIDESGNDSYMMNSGLGQGGSHDFAASVMMDRDGLDRYLGSTSCNGSGLTNAVGLFFERKGNDLYGADPEAMTLGGGRWARDTGSIGVFVDAGGKDHYPGLAKDDSLWTQTVFGAGLDVEPSPGKGETGQTTAQADTVGDEGAIDIPRVCSYEGELTEEVFEELWEIAVRWEVGDNRVIVPKARERLIAFGVAVLPKIDGKFADSYSGLASRAYAEILPALYKEGPDEVTAMLLRNLKAPEEERRRNALAVIGGLKLADLGREILPLLDDDALRGTAIETLSAIGSDAGNDRLKAFLSPGREERLILRAASALLKLQERDIYPQLRTLLDHEYFTVREGIAAMLAANFQAFRNEVEQDLAGEGLNRRVRLGLLRACSGCEEFGPSSPLFKAVSASLQAGDAVERAFAARALKHWMSFKAAQWSGLKTRIAKRLRALEKTETDAQVLAVLQEP